MAASTTVPNERQAFVTVELFGSPYEQRWSLLHGSYRLRVNAAGLQLEQTSVVNPRQVTIARKLLRTFGVRQSHATSAYFFVEIGSK